MEKRRFGIDGPGYQYPRSEEARRDDHLRGALLFRALLRAAERDAVLVVGGPAVADVAHPNLARVLEAGEVEGTPFALVEDLRDAKTVAELVAEKGAAHWQEAVALGRGLARALDALHTVGLVHGDLALSSVHVNARWEPLLARRIERGEPARNLVELGAILYALATGTLPASEPVAPRAIVEEIPEKLEKLIGELLAGRGVSAARAALALDALVG
ncbi:MAG: hypothetical protein ACAI25_07150 [Planctomycetota bacterium]